jgi:hypothetical protein
MNSRLWLINSFKTGVTSLYASENSASLHFFKMKIVYEPIPERIEPEISGRRQQSKHTPTPNLANEIQLTTNLRKHDAIPAN